MAESDGLVELPGGPFVPKDKPGTDEVKSVVETAEEIAAAVNKINQEISASAARQGETMDPKGWMALVWDPRKVSPEELLSPTLLGDKGSMAFEEPDPCGEITYCPPTENGAGSLRVSKRSSGEGKFVVPVTVDQAGQIGLPGPMNEDTPDVYMDSIDFVKGAGKGQYHLRVLGNSGPAATPMGTAVVLYSPISKEQAE